MIPVIEITRRVYLPDLPTLGELRMTIPGEYDSLLLGVTLELPWRNNQKHVSCIPEGIYRGYRSWFNKKGYEVFELEDVPGRAEILIHKGNTVLDIEGCILVGTEFGVVQNRWAVINSAMAFNQLMAELKGVPEVVVFIHHQPYGPGTKGLY